MEFDTPEALLSDANSEFSSLVEQTGVAESGHLRLLANGDKSNAQQNQETISYDETALEDTSETDPFLTSIETVI